jgi:ribosomal peptide maturation radical SAM protein 1
MQVRLLHVPFAMRRLPSLGLTQLQAVVRADPELDANVTVDYLHHDFARILGSELYDFVAGSKASTTAGLGEWFFRQSAFPDEEDNSDLYFRRYFPHNDTETKRIREVVRWHRTQLDGFIDELIDSYDLGSVDVVGLSTMFAQTTACLAFARRIKRKNPNAITVMGGANCEAPMGQAIARNAPDVDYVFSGPALESFPEFLHSLAGGRRDRCGKIQGIFTSSLERGLTTLDSAAALGKERDINDVLPLDYDSFVDSVDANFKRGELDPILLFETSRGCWWGARNHCTFCGLNGSNMAFRTMQPLTAIPHLNELFRYRDRVSLYNAVDNIMPHKYADSVFTKTKAPNGVSIFYEIKTNVNDGELRILANAGVDRIQPGIEALNTSTLKLMRKGCTAFQNLALLKSCLTHRVRPVWNLLVGFPGEGAEVYEKYDRDLPRLVHLPPPMGAYPVRFDRYSPYFMEAERYELDLAPHEFYELTFPWSAQDIRQLAYYFRDRNIYADYIQAMLEWIGPLRGHTQRWMTRWREAKSKGYPLLYWADRGNGVIFDSRSEGTPREHQLDDASRKILLCLSVPRGRKDLDRICEDPERVVAGLRQLDSLGLLFQEDGRWLSLVLDAPPTDPEWFVI